jgi:hypothetical protein
MQSTKLTPRYIGPFTVLKCLGDAYTLDIPSRMRLHPTFYVGRLKEYHPSRPSFVDHSVNERDSLSQPSQPGSFPASSSKKDSLVEDLRPSYRDLVCGPPDQIVLSQQQDIFIHINFSKTIS